MKTEIENPTRVPLWHRMIICLCKFSVIIFPEVDNINSSAGNINSLSKNYHVDEKIYGR